MATTIGGYELSSPAASRGRSRPAEVPKQRLRAARDALHHLLGPVSQRRFTVDYWGDLAEVPPGASSFTLLIRSPAALRCALLPPSEARIGAAFVTGDLDVRGDLLAALDLGDSLRPRLGTGALARALPHLLRLPHRDRSWPALRRIHPKGSPHSPSRDAAAVRAHYDVGKDFYALWLDRDLVYSCAYFPSEDLVLDGAQRAKLDLVCRKLRLRPGERLLDVGCGWGALVRHAARHYGVRALGITLSPPQAELATRRLCDDGLSSRCRVEVLDYRALEGEARFEKVASIGMVEHVGSRGIRGYLERIYRLLSPGGLFLNHGIITRPFRPSWHPTEWLRTKLWCEGSFLGRLIFPDGELLPLDRIIGEGEARGFETVDVETLRRHYARTLRLWRGRLERSRERAQALVGTATYRAWRLYLAGCERAFASGRLDVAQVLFAKPGHHGELTHPPTRADLYA